MPREAETVRIPEGLQRVAGGGAAFATPPVRDVFIGVLSRAIRTGGVAKNAPPPATCCNPSGIQRFVEPPRPCDAQRTRRRPRMNKKTSESFAAMWYLNPRQHTGA